MKHSYIAAFFMFFILLGLPLFLLSTSGADLHISIVLIPLAMIVVYASAHLAKIIALNTQNIVTTTFWVFSYIFLGISPFLQITTNTFPWKGNYDELLLIKGSITVLCGLLAFDIGRHLIPATGVVIPKLLRRPLNRTTVVTLSFFAFVCSPYILHRIGGLAMLFIPRGEKNRLLISEFELPELMLLTHGLNTPIYVLLVASLAVWVAYRVRGAHVGSGWKLMSLILLLATLILNNPISTARFKVGTIILGLFFVLPWRRWSGAATVGGLVFALLFVFPFVDLFRNTLDARLSDRVAQSSTVKELTENGDFDAFQMIVNSVSVVDRSGYQLGRQIGGAFLFWVPRSMWPDKPIATGQWVAENNGYGFTNLSSPLWAELYVDGGWLLLIVGFVGYGYLVRTIDRWHALSSRVGTPQVVSIIVPIYAGYQFFLLRGALMPALAYFTPMLLVALLCSLRIRGRRVCVARTVVGSTASRSEYAVEFRR